MNTDKQDLAQLFLYRYKIKMFVAKVVLLTAFLGQKSALAAQKYWDRSITILLPEGQEDCYFLPNVKAKQDVDIEFQVRAIFKNCLASIIINNGVKFATSFKTKPRVKLWL